MNPQDRECAVAVQTKGGAVNGWHASINSTPGKDGRGFGLLGAGNILGGSSVSNEVPNITTQQGQNACLYTLEHTAAASASNAPASKGGAVQGLANKLGGQLKGLLGH